MFLLIFQVGGSPDYIHLPTDLKRQAPSSPICLIFKPLLSFNVFSNHLSSCNINNMLSESCGNWLSTGIVVQTGVANSKECT